MSAADECFIAAGNSGRCMRERHKEQHDREDIRYWWKKQGVDIDAPCTVRADEMACDRA